MAVCAIRPRPQDRLTKKLPRIPLDGSQSFVRTRKNSVLFVALWHRKLSDRVAFVGLSPCPETVRTLLDLRRHNAQFCRLLRPPNGSDPRVWDTLNGARATPWIISSHG